MSKELGSGSETTKETLNISTRKEDNLGEALVKRTKETQFPLEHAIGTELKFIRETVQKEVKIEVYTSSKTKELSSTDKKKVMEKKWRENARKITEFIKLRDELVNRNLALVKEFVKDPTDIDAYNTAIALLYEKAEDYHTKHGTFESYVKPKLKEEMDDFAMRQAPIDIPEDIKRNRKEAQEIADLIMQRKKTQRIPEGRLTNREIVTTMNKERKKGQKISEEEVKFLLTSTVFEEPLRITSTGEITDGVSFATEDEVTDHTKNTAEEAENRAFVAKLMKGGDERRKAILAEHYFWDKEMRDIAKERGISRGRLTALHNEAIVKKRVRLRDEGLLETLISSDEEKE